MPHLAHPSPRKSHSSEDKTELKITFGSGGKTFSTLWQKLAHVCGLLVCARVYGCGGRCCYLCGRTTLQRVGGAGNTRRPGSKIAGSTKSWRAMYVHKNIPAAHGCASVCESVCVATAIKRDI